MSQTACERGLSPQSARKPLALAQSLARIGQSAIASSFNSLLALVHVPTSETELRSCRCPIKGDLKTDS